MVLLGLWLFMSAALFMSLLKGQLVFRCVMPQILMSSNHLGVFQKLGNSQHHQSITVIMSSTLPGECSVSASIRGL